MLNKTDPYVSIIQNIYNGIDRNKGRKNTLVFAIPSQLYGNTRYTLKSCVVLVLKVLRDQNFKAYYKAPNLIIIENMKKTIQSNNAVVEILSRPLTENNKEKDKKRAPIVEIFDETLMSILNYSEHNTI